jgi:hypothetical protein
MNSKHLREIVIACLFTGFFHSQLFSQTLKTDSAKINISGYVDAYYAFYTDSVGDGNYQKFPSVSPRSDAFGLNTAMITAQYDAEKVRGIVTLHYGDIPRSTWSSSFNMIMEAHAGFRLCPKVWIDAGFFRTHFGTEGLLPKENICSAVSVNTYFEPYFESGIRLNYNPTEKLAIFVYGLNGYNMFEDNNHKKSFGLLATYALGDAGNIGYSNYTGDDSPTGDTVTHLRIHNNLFFNYQIKKLKIQIGGDYCFEQHADIATGTKTATMASGVLALKYTLPKSFAVYGRGEFFNDPDGFMSGVLLDKQNQFTGFKMWGATLGVEYKPTENSYLRLEGREIMMDKDQEIFHWNSANTNARMEAMLNFGISF